MENKSISKKKAIVLIITIGILSFIAGAYFLGSDYSEDGVPLSDDTSSCNVLAFSVNGYLSTYMPLVPEDYADVISSSEDIVDGILAAKEDSDIKAVLLSVDSGGGDAVAGEEIAHALVNLNKLSVAVIRGIGASSAYWAATGADKIYASKISDVGSIGITASYLDETKKNQDEGYKYTELSSGKYKDLGNPAKPLTAEERNIVLSDLEKDHEVFVEDVAQNRNLDVAKVRELANGLTYVGTDALGYGLIDEIGDYTSALKYIEDQIGEKADICWY